MDNKTINLFSEILLGLGPLVGLIALSFTVYHNSKSRTETNFQNILNSLGSKEKTVRTIGIGMLKKYIEKAHRRPNRSEVVARALANHFIHETDRYVAELCSYTLLDSDIVLHKQIVDWLKTNLISQWEYRNRLFAKFQNDTKNKSFIEQRDSVNLSIRTIRRTIVEFFKKDIPERYRFLDFRNTHFDYTDFHGANLENCDFTGCTFTHVNFKGAIITKTKFDHSIVLNSYFSGNNIEHSTFNGTIFGRCHFHDLVDGKNPASHNRMKSQAKYLIFNKYTDKNGNDISLFTKEDNEKRATGKASIILTKEFDWNTTWIPYFDSPDLYSGEQESIYYDDSNIIKMRFRFLSKDETNAIDTNETTYVLRACSSDNNNGYYAIEKNVEIEPKGMRYISGYRTLVSCTQFWEGVKWDLMRYETEIAERCEKWSAIIENINEVFPSIV